MVQILLHKDKIEFTKSQKDRKRESYKELLGIITTSIEFYFLSRQLQNHYQQKLNTNNNIQNKYESYALVHLEQSAFVVNLIIEKAASGQQQNSLQTNKELINTSMSSIMFTELMLLQNPSSIK